MINLIRRTALLVISFAAFGLTSGVFSQTITIGVSQPNVEHPYRVGGIARAQAWAAQHPDVRLIIADGRRDSAVQMATIEDLIQRNVDIIVMSPNNSQALTPVADAAQRANIPLVIFDRELNVEPSRYAAYIGSDDIQMGQAAAQFLADIIKGEGKVIQLEGTPGASATLARKQGFETEMAKHPDIRIVSYVGHYRLSDAVAVMEDVATAHRDLVAIYAHNDSMALGAAKVVQERGLHDIPIIGIDGAKEGCDGLAAGMLAASIHYPTMFPQALELALKVLKKEPLPKRTILPTPVLTTANMAQYCN